jgi:hypothetical protein
MIFSGTASSLPVTKNPNHSNQLR